MAAAVRCPICGKQVPLNDPNSPFCSDRCRIIDLANWATEKYVISGPAAFGEAEDSPGSGREAEDSPWSQLDEGSHS